MDRRIYLYSISFLFLFSLFCAPISESVVAERLSPKTADSALQTPTIGITPSTVTVQVGNNFTINIIILDVTDLYGWEFKLKWNSTLLNATNVTEGPFLKTGGDTFFAAKINNTAGSLLADCTLLGNVLGVYGNGTLAILTFHVKEFGECPLDLYGTTLINSLEQAIQHQTIDGYGYFTSSAPPMNQYGGGRAKPPLLK